MLTLKLLSVKAAKREGEGRGSVAIHYEIPWDD